MCKKLRIGQNPQSQANYGGVEEGYSVVQRVAGGSVDGFRVFRSGRRNGTPTSSLPIGRVASIFF
ncbi:protein of unknown function [Methylocaldum szegediense]|uniref:Uncharacterized protein n=1 Tax=Methylocaldum szegediense TaxID=73780 RepID=A0ABN8X3K2_9GAMM|nr:protein of unknown function [Methylocaldum szegediense]